MAVKKSISPSRRGEGSRAKPKAKRVSPSMRKEGSKRVAPTRPSKIQESGVGNVPMTIAKGLSAIFGRSGSATSKTAATRLSGSTTSGVSKVTGGVLKRGKPAKYGPAKKTLTPAEKGAQTRAMKKARASYAAEGTKKSVSSAKSKINKRKIGAGIGAGVGAGAVLYGATRGSEGPKRSTNSSKVGNTSGISKHFDYINTNETLRQIAMQMTDFEYKFWYYIYQVQNTAKLDIDYTVFSTNISINYPDRYEDLNTDKELDKLFYDLPF